MKNSAASPRLPAATSSVKVRAVSAGGRGNPSGMYGGSQSASLVIFVGSLRAASSASAAPEDEPYRHAEPPAAAATAAVPPVARSTPHGGVAPRAPRRRPPPRDTVPPRPR